ncbi:MAG TPA: EAL domain-containing protein [Solirubrobacteraceae bacterium]|nr:EAL domain-containing protein [Solirubrobacteraceae bacterium]
MLAPRSGSEPRPADRCRPERQRAQASVRSTIDLARNLELTVVAEGIETEAVLNHLTALGCDTAQGYFISRPQPPEQLMAMLARSGEIRSTLAGTNLDKPKLTRV